MCFPIVLGMAGVARAQTSAPEPPPDEATLEAESAAKKPESAPDASPIELAHLLLDDGRKKFAELDPEDRFHIETHGEFQLRGESDSSLPLQAPISDPTLQTLGAKQWGTTWIRAAAQLSVGDTLRLFTQVDLVPGWTFGDLTRGVSASGDGRDTNVTGYARLRQAYVDWKTPIGVLRVGQIATHWGLGLLANDGDHALRFGDYRNGSLVERVAFATRPLGEASHFTISLAGDAVLHDATAKWTGGDRAYQGVLAAYYEKDETFVGFYGVRRVHQVAVDSSLDAGHIRVWVADVAARGAVSVGESGNVFAYGGAEIAAIFGKTDAIRPSPEVVEQSIRQLGALVQIGLVQRATARDGSTFGRIAFQLDGGYASGDADPYDGTLKRFAFDSNAQVGLVLFPYALHYMSARAATNALDPSLGARGVPGSRFLDSRGGVFGAQFLNPTLIVRPTARFDVKLGVVVAVATADLVDPYRLATIGNAVNYRGGDSRARDLGVELDYGFEWRVRFYRFNLAQLGFQGGVLFPGHAFDDATGASMKPQTVMQGRFGMQF